MKGPLKWLIVSILLVIGLIVFGPFILFSMYSAHYEGSAYPDFTAYENREPLMGATIESTSLIKVPGYFSQKSWQFTQKYSSGIGLSQYKDTAKESFSCPATTGSSTTVTSTCKEFLLRNGGRGSVTTTYIGDKLLDLDIKASMNGTTLAFYDISEENRKQMANYSEWQQYFDDMKPIDLCKIDSPNNKLCFLRGMLGN